MRGLGRGVCSSPSSAVRVSRSRRPGTLCELKGGGLDTVHAYQMIYSRAKELLSSGWFARILLYRADESERETLSHTTVQRTHDLVKTVQLPGQTHCGRDTARVKAKGRGRRGAEAKRALREKL